MTTLFGAPTMADETCPLQGWSPNQTDQFVWKLLLAEEEQETVYKIPTFALLCVLMAVGLPGNILVLLVYGFRFPGSTTKSFIMAMAVFDLINCVVGMPFEMVDLRYDVEFNIPVPCKIIRFWISLSACGSVTVLLAVSIDRFRRICRAFRKQMTIKQSRVLIGTLTLVSVLVSLPALILYGRHTERRYNLELHDCSIDDEYRSTASAAAYQYFLGGTWLISIGILVVMYGFIIYKIHLQKKRRENLSNQSCDSSIFNRLKKLSSETNASDKNKDIRRVSIDNRLLIRSGHKSDSRVRQQPDEGNAIESEVEDNVSVDEQNSKLINRLFSRDVNPIFDDAEDNGQVNDFCDSDDEILSLPGLSCNARLISSTRTSLNNYLSSSQETELVKRSTSLIQDPIHEEVGIDDNGEDGEARSAKAIGRYRSWESEQMMREISLISSALKREWASQTDDILDADGGQSLDMCCQIRRASSQGNLACAEHDLIDNQPNKMYWLPEKQNGDINQDARDENEIPEELRISSDNSNKQNGAISPTSISMASPLEKNENCHLIQDSSNTHNINNSNEGEASLHCRDCPKVKMRTGRKHKSSSIDTTLLHIKMKKKKSSVREIKTSKVSIMMLMVTAGFVLSYLPHLGIQIFKNIFPSTVARLLCTSQAYFVVHHFLMRFFFINNAINPIIYSFYNKTFRERCLRILKSPKALFQSSQMYISNVHSISQDNDTS